MPRDSIQQKNKEQGITNIDRMDSEKMVEAVRWKLVIPCSPALRRVGAGLFFC